MQSFFIQDNPLLLNTAMTAVTYARVRWHTFKSGPLATLYRSDRRRLSTAFGRGVICRDDEEEVWSSKTGNRIGREQRESIDSSDSSVGQKLCDLAAFEGVRYLRLLAPDALPALSPNHYGFRRLADPRRSIADEFLRESD